MTSFLKGSYAATKCALLASKETRLICRGFAVEQRTFHSKRGLKHESKLVKGHSSEPNAVTPVKPIKQELIKNVSVEFHGVVPARFNDMTEWHPIYRMPYLHFIRRVVKVKVYLTAISFTSSLIYVSQLLLGESLEPLKAIIMSTLTLGGLAYIGDYARRLIVQIYVSDDLEYIRLCRLTFFGRRRDIVVPRDCIVRLSEINKSPRQLVFDVKFMMPKQGVDLEYDYYEFYELGMRILVGLGGVIDKDKFNAALGKILVDKR